MDYITDNIIVSTLNFFSVIRYYGYRENMGRRGEMSQYLQLILKWFRKKIRHTQRITDKCGKPLISKLGQQLFKCSLYYSLGGFFPINWIILQIKKKKNWRKIR